MHEGPPERQKIVPIETGRDIRRKEQARRSAEIMRELEALIPLLFEAENKLILAKQYIRDRIMQNGIADNLGENAAAIEMQDTVDELTAEIMRTKDRMNELLAELHRVEEKDVPDDQAGRE